MFPEMRLCCILSRLPCWEIKSQCVYYLSDCCKAVRCYWQKKRNVVVLSAAWLNFGSCWDVIVEFLTDVIGFWKMIFGLMFCASLSGNCGSSCRRPSSSDSYIMLGSQAWRNTWMTVLVVLDSIHCVCVQSLFESVLPAELWYIHVAASGVTERGSVSLLVDLWSAKMQKVLKTI